MKKKLNILILVLLFTVLLSQIILAQSLNPGSASSTGSKKDSFSVTQAVYVKSDDVVCTINKTVDLYIINSQIVWKNGDNLTDLRGEPQKVTTTMGADLPLTKIWDEPKSGEYDIVVDCNGNGMYDADPFLEPVDDTTAIGFTVTAPKGSAKVSLGSRNPVNRTFQFDPELPFAINEMLQIGVIVEIEDIIMENITFEAFGTGNEQDIELVQIYADINGNGEEDLTDVEVWEGKYSVDNGKVAASFQYNLTKNTTTNFIFIYTLRPEAKGNFSINVLSASGRGIDSDKVIDFSSLPLSSNVLQVLAAKICSGKLTFELSPSSAKPLSGIKASVGNLTLCEGKVASIKENSCASLNVSCSCAVGASGCECNFVAGSENKNYFTCVDKNSDNDYLDFGESISKEFVVIKEVKLPEEVKENVTNVSVGEVTGKVVEEEKPQAQEKVNLVFVAIEVTLVLILVVLLLILIALASRGKPVATSSRTKAKEKEVKSDEE